MAERVREALGGELQGKKVGVLGLTFKPNTDDMRDAPSLVLIKRLQEGGAEVVAFDPVGREQAEPMLPGVTFAADAYAVAADADALVLVTEWDEFRALDLRRVASAMRGNQLIDLRNVYDPEDVRRAGLSYRGIGRGEQAS
jgi:UDPglucose 6-dehydrogenase